LFEIVGSRFGGCCQASHILSALLVSLLNPIQFLTAQLGQLLRIAAQLNNALLVSMIEPSILLT
jgi:hypothetical protein